MSLQSTGFQDEDVQLATLPRSQIHSIDRILIVRLGAMGDVIHTLPAVQIRSRSISTFAYRLAD